MKPAPFSTDCPVHDLHDAVREIIESRLDGMDKAITLLQASFDKSPSMGELAIETRTNLTSIQQQFVERDKTSEIFREFISQQPETIQSIVNRLRELHDEKFHSIALQFAERDTRTEQTSRDSKVAVDAALQAAKEAVGEQNKSSALAISKSETATAKQIDQISVLIETMRKGLDDKIDDIKERLTTIEGNSTGRISASNSAWGYVVGAVGIAAGLIATFIALAKLRG